MDKKELNKSAKEVADGFRAGFIWLAFWPILFPILAIVFICGLIYKAK